ncbi:carbon monoxide dehydrogenase beta subunit family protein [Acetivibrio saccincola]|uniref:CO dehydrogenase beta subunit/acetyl-CoA synthase epsilon subunit n=2 Tax=Acetivibrio saccincola TaxID=1677857 RepID=A0A2K9EBJ3_9FIRM|nr:carbon monoxide dehydrogenase beta subunit family protein [Acetivibrio saccincola]AUG57534.1 CO dehydrogenase beta subunit/acetyl-CoA synthase epsilon subunit [Acetivibrio saccincola]HOA98291.1 carbon monoxide dehydrogenase beta subunit family protein [Acetivibrio saccincola]HQD29534.1 carbon monoxide dehydrogenase beta subunit family protein [Acetivibrio saccincola]
MQTCNYKVKPGPEGFVISSAAMKGVVLPEKGESLVEGCVLPETDGMKKAAEKLLSAKNPVFVPGPLILWNWMDGVEEKAKAFIELANTVGAKIIPMPDYRPKYPKIEPEVELNPIHSNLTIMHHNIDVCVFAGVHSHYANIALKLIRGGTSCYTISLSTETGNEDAMISIRDVDAAKIRQLTEITKNMKCQQGGKHCE